MSCLQSQWRQCFLQTVIQPVQHILDVSPMILILDHYTCSLISMLFKVKELIEQNILACVLIDTFREKIDIQALYWVTFETNKTKLYKTLRKLLYTQ